jgi:hypothetical protein
MSGIWEPRVLSLSKGGRLLSQQAFQLRPLRDHLAFGRI